MQVATALPHPLLKLLLPADRPSHRPRRPNLQHLYLPALQFADTLADVFGGARAEVAGRGV